MDLLNKDIRGVICGKLRPIDLMMLCGVSKDWLAAAYTPELRGRRYVEEAARYGTPQLLEYSLTTSTPTQYAFIVAATMGNLPR